MRKMRVYYGSYCEVRNPSLDKGRAGADFGAGFYLTSDLLMAEKWGYLEQRTVTAEKMDRDL